MEDEIMSTSSYFVGAFSMQSSFLRKALLADALLTAITGITAVLGSGLLANLLRLRPAWLVGSGSVLIAFASLVAYLATRERAIRPWVVAVIASNALWVVGSFLLLLFGWIDPNLLGRTFVIGQAVIVAVLAELEFMGLRRLA
jgi:CHASE2 domain-containing sensor protein